MVSKKNKPINTLEKCPTGISGLDEITLGGLPRNRTTLVCGAAGTGKSMLGMEFLVNGAILYQEPGLYVSFEESAPELIKDSGSIGLDVKGLVDRHQLIIDHVEINRTEFEETGNYNLDGLFIRLANNIDTFKIKRVVLDTIEVLFSGFSNNLTLRSELQRLFNWFKRKNLTIYITAEQGKEAFTRLGIEEYVSDCVILLDLAVNQQIATRRIRVAKYRGSAHGYNEYPFIISETGFFIAPITSIQLDYKVTSDRVSSGIKGLDEMLSGEGFYRGSSVLISGPAGIGKSSFSAAFTYAACQRKEKCIYFSFEESTQQIVRNMTSIGFNFKPLIKKNLIRFEPMSINSVGLESHLAYIQHLTTQFNPNIVIIDPITNLRNIGNIYQVHSVLFLLMAFFKQRGITVMFLSLIIGDAKQESALTTEGISSLMDTWIFLEFSYCHNDRTRCISVLKSRGMYHSPQRRDVLFSEKGIKILESSFPQVNMPAESASVTDKR